PFDYSEFTQGPSAVPIEDIAALLATHIKTVLEDNPGATQVDVVAHSMGGLITRAWMAGMSPLTGIPYKGQIRKLILIGTPNYGADTRFLDELCLFLFGGQGCSEVALQMEQMKFGSEFIWTLHNRWEEFKQSNIPKPELLYIAGTQGSRNSGFECNDAQGCNDGIVDISSAVLPDTPAERIRYVPYRHADTDSFIVIDPGTFGPLGGPTIAGVTDEQHATYRLVKEFLKNDKVLNQCCGVETVDYNPPHLRGIRRKQEGLFLVRLLDASTGQPVGQVPLRLRLSPKTNFDWQGNQEGSSVTAWGVNASGVYDITVGGLLFYRAGTLQDIQINVARPTVPPPLELTPK
ncbi:MAG: hypothetical protein MN733_21180, partial [Nitrososphaera sp.]|nr:hypothetical protein [Nitrososphaera sp.]